MGEVLLLVPSLVAACVVASLVMVLRRGEQKRHRAEAPFAPNALPLFYHTFEVLKHAHEMHDWSARLCEQFGDQPFRTKIFGRAVCTVLNTPALVEDVLKTQFDSFVKGAVMSDNLHTLLGTGIFAVDGAKWIHQRKTASNLFTMRSLRDSMARTVQELIPTVLRHFRNSADTGEPIDVVTFLNRFTMEAFAKIGFGVDLNGLAADEDHPFMTAFDSAQRLSTLRFVRPRIVWKLQYWLQIGAEAELAKHVRVIDDTVFSIIERSLERRTKAGGGHQSKDIVSLFIDDVSHDSKRGDEPFDPKFLRDVVVNFLIAGRDTTAQALSWFFYELSENPRVEERIRDELCGALPHLFDRAIDAVPSLEQVHRLTYLEAALKETHPSVPSNSRRATKDTVLCDGTFIPKGTIVSFSSYSMGRATHVWGPDAKAFRPERWLDAKNPENLTTVSPYQFNAFLAGPRMCLGINLAMMEMKIFVASVLSKFHLEIVPDQTVTYDLSMTLPVKGSLLMRVRSL